MASSSRKGAPECGLYIRIGDRFVFEDLLKKLQQVFFAPKTSDYEKNMHVVEFPSHDVDADELRGLIEFAQKNGFVAMLRGNAALAKEWGADGVMLERLEDIVAARRSLGDESIIGLRCGSDRHLAEHGAKLGIDCVALTGGPDLIAWWSTKSDNPVIAEGFITNENCGSFVSAGATFVESSAFILDHPKGALQGTADMLHAIDLALGKRVLN